MIICKYLYFIRMAEASLRPTFHVYHDANFFFDYIYLTLHVYNDLYENKLLFSSFVKFQ